MRDSLIDRVKSLSINYRQQLQILLEELLLKKRSKRVISCSVSLNSGDLLDVAYHLKTVTKADALIVGNKSLEILKTDRRFSQCVVPLAEYRDSSFEKDRRRYENGVEHIDGLPKSEVADLIIRAVRFTKWLRFYDPIIGSEDNNNTSRFRKGIEYILSLWEEHGFFASQQGTGSVEIFTCRARRFQTQDELQKRHQSIDRELITPLKKKFPWPVKLCIKDDRNRIFHARYMETQHAVVRVERGFDLFKQNGEFRRNFFTLNMAERSHLKECRDLPTQTFDNVP